MSRIGLRQTREHQGVFGVEALNTTLLIVFVGLPLAAAAVWIAGFVVSAIVSPIAALYEDLFGYNRHHGPSHA